MTQYGKNHGIKSKWRKKRKSSIYVGGEDWDQF